MSEQEPSREDGGFADPTLIAGRPFGALVYVAGIVVAAVADIAAFRQVLEPAMLTSSAQTVTMVVYGFVGIAILLMHFAGVSMRERQARRGWIKRIKPWLFVVAWTALGATAFYVRVAEQVKTAVEVNHRAPLSGGPHFTPASFMFLALYVGTGLVALAGAYFTHNPERAAFVRTKWALIFASRRFASSVLRLEIAEGTRGLYELNQQSAAAVLALEQARRHAFGEALKQHARLVIAQRSKDPALTDALFPPERPPAPNLPPGGAGAPSS
ncbi:hypothetical protein [Dactylosporangium sp. CA-092794]|uniref:hypothetical protein n=1 Tax=Dactylosporangium sp. CA-092794 TaxID=3239929 RepID=UPI003D946F71